MSAMELIWGGVASLVLTGLAAWAGSRFMPDHWYRQLQKPTWNPPDQVFGPVWSGLYLMMAGAAWLVWRESGGVEAAAIPLALYAVQLVLNAVWPWQFFGRHRMQAALADIVLLWLVILATLVAFWQVTPLAGALLLPYLAWVSFASVLNYAIWRRNPRVRGRVGA